MKKRSVGFIIGAILGTIVVIILLAFFLTACAPALEASNAELLAESNLLGRHPLKGVSSNTGISGDFSAGFLLFAGTANGSISTNEYFTLAWYPKPGDEARTRVPASKIRIITQEYTEEHPGPEVEFILNSDFLSTPSNSSILYPMINDSVLQNPNLLFESPDSNNVLVLVRVYLSEADQTPSSICP